MLKIKRVLRRIIRFSKKYNQTVKFFLLIALCFVLSDIIYNQIYPLYKFRTNKPREWAKDYYVENSKSEELMKCMVKISNGMSATGVIVDDTKEYIYILTNFHVAMVISEYSRILFMYEKKDVAIKDIEQLGGDIFNDLYLIRIKRLDNIEFKIAKLSKQDVKIGDKVYVVGNPLSIPQVYGEGIVSHTKSRGRIFISVPTAPGSSGSPVFNKDGELVAVVHAVAFTYLDRGFRRSEKILFPYITICISRDKIEELLDKATTKIEDLH